MTNLENPNIYKCPSCDRIIDDSDLEDIYDCNICDETNLKYKLIDTFK